MSLKDRLNTIKTKSENLTKKENQLPKYYESSEIANIETLGILENLFVDDDLNSIYVNGAKNVYIEKNGKHSKSTLSFRDNVQLENLIKFNHKKGINVQATLPPLSNPANIFIKCYKDKHASIKILSENQSVSKEMALILEAVATIKNNIIIAGERNTLKTTVLSSLLKLLPNNNRGALIDLINEIETNSKNYSNFDFSNIDKNKNEILNSIINSSPDMLGFNDPDDEIIAHIIKKIKEGLKGAIITICAKNKEEAMEKIALAILKENPNLDYKKAKLISVLVILIIITEHQRLLMVIKIIIFYVTIAKKKQNMPIINLVKTKI